MSRKIKTKNEFGAVSKLQNEIDFLCLKIVQLEDKHKQQLMSQDKRHEDEILKYKRLLNSAEAKLLLVLIINFLLYAFIYLTNLLKFSLHNAYDKKRKKKKEIYQYK